MYVEARNPGYGFAQADACSSRCRESKQNLHLRMAGGEGPGRDRQGVAGTKVVGTRYTTLQTLQIKFKTRGGARIELVSTSALCCYTYLVVLCRP